MQYRKELELFKIQTDNNTFLPGLSKISSLNFVKGFSILILLFDMYFDKTPVKIKRKIVSP